MQRSTTKRSTESPMGKGTVWALFAGALAMLAARPAARPALAFFELFLGPADAALPGGLLLGVIDPADELVVEDFSGGDIDDLGHGAFLGLKTTPRVLAQARPEWKASVAALGLVFLRRQHLAALVHAGLQVDVVRAAQLTRFLVLDIAVGLQGMVGPAHAGARGGDFAFRDGHGVDFSNGVNGGGGQAARVSGRLCLKAGAV